MDELMKLCGVLIGAMTKISAMEILRRIRFRLAKKKYRHLPQLVPT